MLSHLRIRFLVILKGEALNIDLPICVIDYVVRQGLSPEETMAKLCKYAGWCSRVNAREQKIRQIEAEADRKVRELRSEMLCCHDITETQGDPSGGSDSSCVCVICGEVLDD